MAKRSTLGWSVVDVLLTLMIAFLALSLEVSDAPPTPPHPIGVPISHLTIQLGWNMADDADVDLWMMGPGEPRAVGFMNPHGRHLSLTWDDLGRSADPDSQNVEFGEAESAIPGEYVVNAMMFNDRDGHFPAHVKVEARYNGQVLKAEGDLMHEGDEITVMRFIIDAKGHLIFENNMFLKLYSGVQR